VSQQQHDKPALKDAPKVKRVCFRNDTDDNNDDTDVLHDATAVVVIEDDSKETFRLSVGEVKARLSERLRAKWSSFNVVAQKDHLAEMVLSEQELAEELAKSKQELAKRKQELAKKDKLRADEHSVGDFVRDYAKFAEIRGALEGATTATTSGGVQPVEVVQCTRLLHLSGTLDEFLTQCGVPAPNDDALLTLRVHFASVMDAWWRQLRSLTWKTEEQEVSGFQALFVKAAMQGKLVELNEVHPIAQSLLYSLFSGLRSAPDSGDLDDLWLFTERDLAGGGWAPLTGVDRSDKHAAVDDDANTKPEPEPKPEAKESPLRRAAFNQALSTITQPSPLPSPPVNGDAGVPRWIASRQGFNKARTIAIAKLTALFVHRNRGVARAPFTHCAQKRSFGCSNSSAT
jgi:hypothetical protein